jgi:hypothetical protein
MVSSPDELFRRRRPTKQSSAKINDFNRLEIQSTAPPPRFDEPFSAL